MSSQIRRIIQQFEEQATQQKEWSINKDSNLNKQVKKIKMLGNHFLSILIINSLSQDDMQLNLGQVIQSRKQVLIRQLQEKHDLKSGDLIHQLGLYMQRKIEVDTQIHQINQQISVLSLEDQDSALERSNLSFHRKELMNQESFSLPGEVLEYQAFLDELGDDENVQEDGRSTTSTSTYASEVSKFVPSNSQSRVTPFQHNSHSEEVMAYLKKLQSPQTQLVFLSQQQSYKLKFIEVQNQENDCLFNCYCNVDLRYKKKEFKFETMHKNKNKKIGRMQASFLMLQKIYLTFPQIWNEYQLIKKEKSLHVPLAETQVPQLSKIKSNIVLENIQVIQTNEKSDQIIKKQYLAGVKSYKIELNETVQQNLGVIALGKFEKMQDPETNLWKVRGSISVKSKGKEKAFVEIVNDKNAKNGEQRIAKIFIQKIFEQFPQILKKMVNIKQKNSLK